VDSYHHEDLSYQSPSLGPLLVGFLHFIIYLPIPIPLLSLFPRSFVLLPFSSISHLLLEQLDKFLPFLFFLRVVHGLECLVFYLIFLSFYAPILSVVIGLYEFLRSPVFRGRGKTSRR
jgi:hypothetical protein